MTRTTLTPKALHPCAAVLAVLGVGVVALGYALLIIADSVRVIWLPVAFGAGLVFILEPAVRAFERMRIPRAAGAILAFLVLATLVLAVSFTLILLSQRLGRGIAP